MNWRISCAIDVPVTSCCCCCWCRCRSSYTGHHTLSKYCFFPLPLQSSIARPGREIFSCLFSAAFESKSWVEDEAKISFSSPSNPTLSNPGFLKLILDLIRHADSSLTQEVNSLTFSLFLVADTQLFKRLCPSVGPAVHEHESKSAETSVLIIII